MRIDINKYNQDYFSILITQMLLGNFMKERNMVVYLFRATSIPQASHLNDKITHSRAIDVVIVQL